MNDKLVDRLVHSTVKGNVELQFHEDGLYVVFNGERIAIFDPSMTWDLAKRWISNTADTTLALRRRKLEAQIAQSFSVHIANLIVAIEEEQEEEEEE